MADPRWSGAQNILCIRLDTMGDVLMATPAMRALKQSGQERRLMLLTSSAGAGIASMVPELDAVIAYDPPWMKATPSRADASPDFAVIERLRGERFDAAVIFTTFSQSPLPAALLCYLAGMPLRLAYCRENPYQLLTDHLPETEPHEHVRHEVQRQLDLVASIGATCNEETLSLQVPAEARSRMRRLLFEEGVDLERPWAVVHPGSTAESRRYPVGHFAEAVRALIDEQGWQVVVTGSEEERWLAGELERLAGRRTVTLAGRTALNELVALISLAPLLISNNTGPVHIAAATGTPVVDIYALTNPQHQPWRVPNRVLTHDVPCAWCYKSVCPMGHHACLREIPPRDVVDAAVELTRERKEAVRV